MISSENNKNNLFRVKSKNGVLRCLKAGMDINMCNSKGQTALFTCNVPEAIQAMIDADIDIHHQDKDGNNALFLLKILKQWNFLSAMVLMLTTGISQAPLRFNILIFHHG